MSKDNRASYVELNNKDNIRYEKELKQIESICLSMTKNGHDSRKQMVSKQKLHDNAIKPKKALTPYNLFFKD